ncbi:hypothetical protein [Microvirga pakistanensis]|uniref:hypothetical protein n=1 Tax=Microvirga pakistanensis TaxID=1682650 RepID=UPI00106A2A41|nr:hypothetical protein [Microvirga pakistanensis]
MPTIMPVDNPFSKMGLKYKAKSTKPVNYESLMRFVKVCDEAGDHSIGTAAMIAFRCNVRSASLADLAGRITALRKRVI